MIPAILLNIAAVILRFTPAIASALLKTWKLDSTVRGCGKGQKACGKLVEIGGKPVESLWNGWGKLW
jgi:hypothetical protein